MASYAVLDKARDRFVLGRRENRFRKHAADDLDESDLELAYWRFGLRVAQQWRERLGWRASRVGTRCSRSSRPLPGAGWVVFDAGRDDRHLYQMEWEHPALLGAFGAQPGDGADPGHHAAHGATGDGGLAWERAWGWDFGMAAMAAARSGEPELAVRALLIEFRKTAIGQRPQLPARKPGAYLPGNGSLLCAAQ